MQFDLEKAIAVLGRGTGGPIDALGMAYGVPSCLVNMTKNALDLLPASVLTDVGRVIEEARDTAGGAINRLIKKTFLLNGIIEFDTESGILKFVSSASTYGLDVNSNKFLKELDAVVNAATIGAALWENYKNIESQVAEIADCIKGLENVQTFADGNSSLLKAGVDFNENDLPIDSQYELEKAKLRSSSEFWNAANKQLGVIGGILAERQLDPSKEPCFYDDQIFSGVDTFCIVSDDPEEDYEQIFDLVFGPPKSKAGKFILTVDGLYYDYLNSAVYDISSIVPKEAIPTAGERYKFEHDPNLGGKGTAISVSKLNQFFDTIFDENKIDNSDDIKEFYDNDHFLQVLSKERNKHVDILQLELSALIAAYGEDDATTLNFKKSIASQVSEHEKKIDKRKKQIEIAVKAPAYYGTGAIFTVGDEIPINDFTFLSSVNIPMALERQKKLIFNQGEVSGVVLPIQPKFVTSPDRGDVLALSHLVVPNVGKGGIITAGDYDGSAPTVLSLTDHIAVDKLAAIYNFLETNLSLTHQDNSYNVLNCATINLKDNAKLVGESAAEVFASGLGFPRFKGINAYSAPSTPSSVGSYALLPMDGELRNLTYSPDGFSIDFWTHIPELDDFDSDWGWGGDSVSSLHKIVLGCENTGGTSLVDNPNRSVPNYGTNTVRGMLVGFTRDRQIVSGVDPTDDAAANSLGMSFYIAPTQSVNTNDVTFINNDTSSACANAPGWYKCKVDTSAVVSGVKFGDVSSDVMHVCISVTPKDNKVEIYLDSNLMTTSSIEDTFGVNPYSAPGIPSFHQVGSFNYDISAGPRLETYFTPWVVGGGWTDGDYDNGGFMGLNSGLRSGLGGHLGSLKFYKKGLSAVEVAKNYNAQRGFFKNIDV